MAGVLTSMRSAAKAAFGPVKRRVEAAYYGRVVDRLQRTVEKAPVDPRIVYPSYKSLDDHIDVDRLRSLDGYIRERLEGRSADNKFWTGPFTVNKSDERTPGSRMVELTRNRKSGYDYFELDDTDLWEPSEYAPAFSELMDFIRTLPFKSIGRALIMYDFDGGAVTAHRDHTNIDVCHEFIWFRTSLKKPFYLMDSKTGERTYVEGHTAWFDTVNQFHGADAVEGLSVSLRVDGVFSDALRALMPSPVENRASTASLWDAIGDAAGRPEASA